ncbi:MAG: AI-2E family transporter, partial [Candidatus Limnocylindrales bacterium]
MAEQPLLPRSEQRWFHALLVMGTIVVALILIGQVAQLLVYFSDILFILVMAWVVAFALSPLVAGILRAFPTLSRGLVAILIYVIILVILVAIVLVAASSLTSSILQFVEELPSLQGRLPEILQPWQNQLSAVGIHIDLVKSAQDLLTGLGSLGGDLVPALTGLALASLGAIGNLMLIVFLSLFILIDKDKMSAFFNRLVPPRYADEARLFETSVAKSVGGFMRGQAIQGLIYAVFAIVTHLVLGLDFMPASAALVALTQTIPFFGPFVSWAPPIVVAALTEPSAIGPAFLIMAVGWFVVMNIVVPKVMADS